MRLSQFILQEMEPILVEWEAFASRQLPAASTMSSLALRDHAHQILEAIAKDIETEQSGEEQREKSQGRAATLVGAPMTAAETHAVLRARSGFDVNQLVAEYRALRATVLRLWMDVTESGSRDLEDVIRFNEAIDQAVAESLRHFSIQVDRSRNLLLGMLGHDMRSPLETIQTTAHHLARLHVDDQVAGASSRLLRCSTSIRALLDDLVDFNRTQLGLGLGIDHAEVDLAPLFADELDQLRGAHPRSPIEWQVSGNTRGHWDGPRLQQVLRNLVRNAVRYGTPQAPVRVSLTGVEDAVCLDVTNSGRPIEPAALEEMFNPLKRGPAQEAERNVDGGLGLGLFIVREVTRAHGGEVAARSGDGETTFTVRLPRAVTTPAD
jgi:signal transduction histidine kinase